MAIEEKEKPVHASDMKDVSEGCVLWKNDIKKNLCGRGIKHEDCKGKACGKRLEAIPLAKKADHETVTMTVKQLRELCIQVEGAKDFDIWWEKARP